MSCPAEFMGCVLVNQIIIPPNRCFCIYRCDDGGEFWVPCPGG